MDPFTQGRHHEITASDLTTFFCSTVILRNVFHAYRKRYSLFPLCTVSVMLTF